MANQKQPIQLIQAKGRKHLTKAEIEQRTNSEVQPVCDNIKPPQYLSKSQKKRFKIIAKQLEKLGVMGETDCEAVARYVVVEELFETTATVLQNPEILNNPIKFDIYTKLLDKYFRQCRASASDLGLTISSRCRLVVPKPSEDKPKNKFNNFERKSG